MVTLPMSLCNSLLSFVLDYHVSSLCAGSATQLHKESPKEALLYAFRLGVRLNGPRPTWSRTDGGEGGSHPSNVHDHTYAIGTINYTGDMPVILMVDGPSLGGFVCPATIVSTELWKIGQVRILIQAEKWIALQLALVSLYGNFPLICLISA